jgi:hypothetical protein
MWGWHLRFVRSLVPHGLLVAPQCHARLSKTLISCQISFSWVLHCSIDLAEYTAKQPKLNDVNPGGGGGGVSVVCASAAALRQCQSGSLRWHVDIGCLSGPTISRVRVTHRQPILRTVERSGSSVDFRRADVWIRAHRGASCPRTKFGSSAQTTTSSPVSDPRGQPTPRELPIVRSAHTGTLFIAFSCCGSPRSASSNGACERAAQG